MVKLTYRISKKTSLNNEIIKCKLVDLLGQNGYRIVNVTKDKIVFDNKKKENGWGLTANEANKMDAGEFDIIDSEFERNITLTYRLSLTIPLILFVIFVLVAIFFDRGTLFFAAGIVLFTLLSIPLTKLRSEDLLDELDKIAQ